MPAIGVPNNGLGINAFSGPMGEKEPAYGAVERLKILTAMAPPGTNPAINAPKRAKRAAVRGKTATTPTAAPIGTGTPAALPADSYPSMLAGFWSSLAMDPGASPLIHQLAAQV